MEKVFAMPDRDRMQLYRFHSSPESPAEPVGAGNRFDENDIHCKWQNSNFVLPSFETKFKYLLLHTQYLPFPSYRLVIKLPLWKFYFCAFNPDSHINLAQPELVLKSNLMKLESSIYKKYTYDRHL